MIKKLLINSTLLIVLFILIGAPMSSMLLTKLKEGGSSTAVLSSQDIKEENEIAEDCAQCENFPAVNGREEVETLQGWEADLPEDIERFIRLLEEEFYQTTGSTPQVEPDILLP